MTCGQSIGQCWVGGCQTKSHEKLIKKLLQQASPRGCSQPTAVEVKAETCERGFEGEGEIQVTTTSWVSSLVHWASLSDTGNEEGEQCGSKRTHNLQDEEAERPRWGPE